MSDHFENDNSQNQAAQPVQMDGPRVYVASLADYVAGRLIGRWINAAQPAEAIRTDIAAMLKESKEPIAEEWAIHDQDGFGSAHLGENPSIENVAELAALIAEHGELFGELAGHFGGIDDLDEAKRYMEEGYRGEYDRIENFVQEFVEDCYGDALKNLPDFLRYHIDYEGVARDMEMGGDIFAIELNGKIHVFWANC